MGNYKFRLSDMMPNAWFYKLRDMSRARNRSNNSMKKPHQISHDSTPKSSSKTERPHHFYPRKSYYFTRELIPTDRFCPSDTTKSTDAHFPVVVVDPPRKSSKQQRPRKRNTRYSSPKLPTTTNTTTTTSSVSSGCSCRATTLWNNKADSPPEYSASSASLSSSDGSNSISDQKLCVSSPQEFIRTDCILTTETDESFDNMVSWSRDMDLKANGNNNIVIDAAELELELPPIITKPAKFNDSKEKESSTNKNNESTKYRRSSAKFEGKHDHSSISVKVVKEERITVKENKNSSPVRKFSVNSPGVRLRINSPKIASRRLIQQQGHRKSVSSSSNSESRKKLSESFAVVKSSFDPQRDFKESMVEMIMENNIRTSKDMEDLLACYLSLNSDEYHDVIIKVFKQIWFDFCDVRLK